VASTRDSLIFKDAHEFLYGITLAIIYDLQTLFLEERINISDYLKKLRISYMISLRHDWFLKLYSTQFNQQQTKMASSKCKRQNAAPHKNITWFPTAFSWHILAAVTALLVAQTY
jgi:hypothetical protein